MLLRHRSAASPAPAELSSIRGQSPAGTRSVCRTRVSKLFFLSQVLEAPEVDDVEELLKLPNICRPGALVTLQQNRQHGIRSHAQTPVGGLALAGAPVSEPQPCPEGGLIGGPVCGIRLRGRRIRSHAICVLAKVYAPLACIA